MSDVDPLARDMCRARPPFHWIVGRCCIRCGTSFMYANQHREGYIQLLKGSRVVYCLREGDSDSKLRYFNTPIFIEDGYDEL